MNLEKRSNEIKARITEIKGLIGAEVTLEVLEQLEAEVDELNKEKDTIERKFAIQNKTKINPVVIERSNQVDKDQLGVAAKYLKKIMYDKNGEIIKDTSELVIN